MTDDSDDSDDDGYLPQVSDNRIRFPPFAVRVGLQDGSEEIVNLDRCHTFKGQPMIERTKDFVQSEKKDMGKSTALVPATKTQVTNRKSVV